MSAKIDKTEKAQKFCKEQLVRSGYFPSDVARAVLNDNKEYTFEEATKAIHDYYERKVK